MFLKDVSSIKVHEAFGQSEECGLCRLRRERGKKEIEHILTDEVCMDPDFRGSFVGHHGLCNAHSHMLIEIAFSVSSGGGAAVATYASDLIENLIRELKDVEAHHLDQVSRGVGRGVAKTKKLKHFLESGDKVARLIGDETGCIVCSSLEKSAERDVSSLVDMLQYREFRDIFKGSKGLCLVHFARSLKALSKIGDTNTASAIEKFLFEENKDNLDLLLKNLKERLSKYAWENRDQIISKEEAMSSKMAFEYLVGMVGLRAR